MHYLSAICNGTHTIINYKIPSNNIKNPTIKNLRPFHGKPAPTPKSTPLMNKIKIKTLKTIV